MKRSISFAVADRFWTAVLFFLSFCVWCLCFREFFIGQIPPASDAIAYFNQIGFFSRSLSEGVFPLWNPDQYFGIPDDFFRLRIGGFNPAYSLLVLARWFKVPFIFSYMFFMAGYFFVGCIGFYRIARIVVRHRMAAVVGFLLLFFSSLGTRIFDSYLILVFTPLILSCLFIMRFCLKPSPKMFFRVIFFLMILASTYIPFYASLILGFGFVLWCCVFIEQIIPVGKRIGRFFCRYWIVVVLGIVLLAGSLIPGMLFFQDTAHGDIVMPGRHGGVDSEESLTVPYKFTARWGLLEELAFSSHFRDPMQIQFPVLFVPIIAWIIFLLGFGVRMTRFGFYVFLWIFILFLLSIPQNVPVYKWFVSAFSFFKYFRNLHFFLWVAILPLLILFLTEQLKYVFMWLEEKQGKIPKLVYICVVHICAALAVSYFSFPLRISYTAILVSFVSLCFCAYGKKFKKLVLLLFLCAIASEFYCVYRHVPAFYVTGRFMCEAKGATKRFAERDLAAVDTTERAKFYVCLNNIYHMVQTIEPETFWQYSRQVFRWYDGAANVAAIDGDPSRFFRKAFLPDSKACLLNGKEFLKTDETEAPRTLQVDKVSANRVDVTVETPRDGVLVFNEVYTSDWHVFIDGKENDLYEANGAFCGVIVPKGRHHIAFVFGSKKKRVLIGTLFCMYYVLGFGLLISMIKKRKNKTS